MATWRVEVDLDGHTPYAEGGVPRPEALAAREGTLLAEDGPTEQYPAEFARKMSQGAPGKALYEKTYQARSFSLLTLVPIRPRSRGERRFLRTLFAPIRTHQSSVALRALLIISYLTPRIYQVHPDPRARWDAAFCASKGTSDASCYPRVTPKVGYTHDANGRRLLTNQGQPLPTGYVDANEPRM